MNVLQHRVRNLIGEANWGADGNYKEAILRKTVQQFLPNNLSIGTGFIVFNDDHIRGQNGLVSTQLDIIIYDNSCPVIFKEGDFVIVTDTMVKAVVEVKSRITNYSAKGKNSLNNILKKLSQLQKFPAFNFPEEYGRKFIGVFSYEYDEASFLHYRVAEALKQSNGFVNHISLGPNKFIRFWEDTDGLRPRHARRGKCYQRYDLHHLSFSYFVSNILHMVAAKDPTDRYWFSFPIEGTKETLRQGNSIWI